MTPSKASASDLRDPGEFRRFYDGALPRVYGYFLNRCGGHSAVAEDLTQETFMSAIRQIKAGVAVQSPVSWLIGIARHKLVDHYRSRERDERKLRALESEPSAHDDSLIWDDAVSRGHGIAALDRVPAPQRAALVLRYVDGLGVPDVAKTLGKTVHATESLLARGRDGFRRAYKEVSGG